MNIAAARKRCNELRDQADIIRKEFDFEGYARAVGREKRKPLEDEIDKLILAIDKAENETEIKL